MRWKGRQGSKNVEDRRGMPGGAPVAAGGGLLVVGIIILGLCMGADMGKIM